MLSWALLDVKSSFGQNTEFNFTFSSSFAFDENETITSTSVLSDGVSTTPHATINTRRCGSDLSQCIVADYWGSEEDPYIAPAFGEPSCTQWNFTQDYWGNVTTVSQTDKDLADNRDNKFRTVMWFTDTIWSGTLSNYQKILQQSFTFAVLDLHDKWYKTPNFTTRHELNSRTDLTYRDVYVNVTFFLGFCLLEGGNCNVVCI